MRSSAPVLTWALFRWRALGAPGDATAPSSPLRLAAATLLVVLIPLWMSSHAAARNGPIRQLGVERRALDLPATTGITLDRAKIQVLRIAPLEALIAHLAEVEPREAPVLLLGNTWVAVFLSERPMLFPEHSGPMVLLGLDMLPDAGIEKLDESKMLERLRRTPDLIVVDDRGDASAKIRSALPRLSAFVDAEFATQTSFGRFQVLRRRTLEQERQ